MSKATLACSVDLAGLFHVKLSRVRSRSRSYSEPPVRRQFQYVRVDSRDSHNMFRAYEVRLHSSAGGPMHRAGAETTAGCSRCCLVKCNQCRVGRSSRLMMLGKTTGYLHCLIAHCERRSCRDL